MGRARIIPPSFCSFDSDQNFALCALSLATTAGCCPPCLVVVLDVYFDDEEDDEVL